MTWTLTWTPEALRDAAPLPRNQRERIVRSAERWDASDYGDVCTVQNLGRVTHRLRVGKWRMLLALDFNTRSATILRVLPRGSAYKR